MEVLRKVGDLELNKGEAMANGLFNLSNEKDVSMWFDEETKDELLSMDEDEFSDEAEKMFNITRTIELP